MTLKRKQAKIIPQDLKTRILQEALLPNSSIPKIAKYYNLSPKTIYNWRNKYHKKIYKSSNPKNSPNPIINIQDNFIELTTDLNTELSSLSPTPNKNKFPNSSNSLSQLNSIRQSNSLNQKSKISLSFNNFSLSLTGSFSPATLIRIINILGESC